VKKILEENNIPGVKLIPDAAVGIAMQQVDSIFVGCEAVVENGGIVNRLGTYTVALCAKTF
jgi:translation initiation factor eIF-2B subunit alpha